jgi:hypothetical protein
MTCLLWSFAAWCALALAIERHHEQVFRRHAGAAVRRAWGACGAAGMVAALAAPVSAQGWALGVLTWVSTTVVAGAATAALLAWRPHWCLQAALGTLLLGAVMAT